MNSLQPAIAPAQTIYKLLDDVSIVTWHCLDELFILGFSKLLQTILKILTGVQFSLLSSDFQLRFTKSCFCDLKET